jgi:dolichol-phosphate mannosyltransferase
MPEPNVAVPPRHPSAVANGSRITIVVPTLREVANIPVLVERLDTLRRSTGLALDVLFMDDDSCDGSMELVESLATSWVRMVVRTGNAGLSQAVLDGLRQATGDVLIVMDADLSHPPEKIPEMLRALSEGADMAVGSRFTNGGTTDDDWGVFRWLNSRVATLLARPLTSLKDPMSGFLALHRSTFLRGQEFNPVGYKIGLELLVKCGCQRVIEIPIHFTDRRLGKSKLSLKEQLNYLRHVRRLYIHKYGTWSHLAQFLGVGLSGVVVNLLLLTMFMAWNVGVNIAIGAAIALTILWNFALNRRFSFSYARRGSIGWQLGGFIASCSVGAVVNFCTTVAAWPWFEVKQLAAILGTIAGTGFNFAASRFVVFRHTHVKPPTVSLEQRAACSDALPQPPTRGGESGTPVLRDSTGALLDRTDRARDLSSRALQGHAKGSARA